MKEIFDPDWQALFIRFLFIIMVVFIVARLFYYHKGKGKEELLFAFISISALVFVICLVLSSVPVEMGFALGLFAIFSVIRFRSLPLSPRELTYLFVCIGLGVYNSLTNMNTNILRIIVGNGLLVALVGTSEWLLFRTRSMTKYITYDRLELLSDQTGEALEKDVKERLGVDNILKIQIGDIDTLKGRVKLKITFSDKAGRNFIEE